MKHRWGSLGVALLLLVTPAVAGATKCPGGPPAAGYPFDYGGGVSGTRSFSDIRDESAGYGAGAISYRVIDWGVVRPQFTFLLRPPGAIPSGAGLYLKAFDVPRPNAPPLEFDLWTPILLIPSDPDGESSSSGASLASVQGPTAAGVTLPVPQTIDSLVVEGGWERVSAKGCSVQALHLSWNLKVSGYYEFRMLGTFDFWGGISIMEAYTASSATLQSGNFTARILDFNPV